MQLRELSNSDLVELDKFWLAESAKEEPDEPEFWLRDDMKL